MEQQGITKKRWFAAWGFNSSQVTKMENQKIEKLGITTKAIFVMVPNGAQPGDLVAAR